MCYINRVHAIFSVRVRNVGENRDQRCTVSMGRLFKKKKVKYSKITAYVRKMS